jgi:hypothetical protein
MLFLGDLLLYLMNIYSLQKDANHSAPRGCKRVKTCGRSSRCRPTRWTEIWKPKFGGLGSIEGSWEAWLTRI